ncbi:MAG: hypothetical protein COB38_08005 [Gammaproteobacteria bacterium]|nr:MAG: hypothetical protein COB38_08005 [Gammaproteobacteria bacterium]
MGSRKVILLSIMVSLLSSCATYKPSNTSDICHIFRGEIDWYEAARESQHDWGTPIYVLMAIMHQESRFVADAQPDRDWLLGFIPLPRKSSAYGYAQAQDPAWNDYMKQTGSWGADRDDFEDAIDFIGWYTDGSHNRLRISKWDTYAQYLAYHEGRGGYSRKSYNKKPWLIGVAKKVARRAVTYNNQLKTCQSRLDDDLDSWF